MCIPESSCIEVYCTHLFMSLRWIFKKSLACEAVQGTLVFLYCLLEKYTDLCSIFTALLENITLYYAQLKIDSHFEATNF